MKTILILSITSDIGLYLAKSFEKVGFNIVGTFREKADEEKIIANNPDFKLIKCDTNDEKSILNVRKKFIENNLSWDAILFCSGQPFPYKNFFEGTFTEWENSLQVNSIHQLKFLHALYDLRATQSTCIFFSSGGINEPVSAFSAYLSAKIHLLKMVEFLDFENPDIKFSIIGPGWVKTKTHKHALQLLKKTDKKYIETHEFLEKKQGTKLDDIFEIINWILEAPKQIVGGRNFSVVHDPWRVPDRIDLEKNLLGDKNLFKLRRKEST